MVLVVNGSVGMPAMGNSSQLYVEAAQHVEHTQVVTQSAIPGFASCRKSQRVEHRALAANEARRSDDLQ